MNSIVEEKVERSFFGKIIKYTFILFNILMIVWLVSYSGEIGDAVNTAESEYSKAGASIGGFIGIYG